MKTEMIKILDSALQKIEEYSIETMKMFTWEFSYLTHDFYIVIQKYDRCLILFVLKWIHSWKETFDQISFKFDIQYIIFLYFYLDYIEITKLSFTNTLYEW